MFERFLWGVGGIASTAVGLLGLVIPIIPGILFLLLAAVCFSRASKPRRNAKTRVYGGRTSVYTNEGFADELRRDLHEQYRLAARLIGRQHRRFKRR